MRMPRAALAAIVLSGIAGATGAAVHAPTRGTPARPAPAGGGIVATVGNTRILRSEFETRAEQAMAEYKRHSGSDIPEEIKPLVRRQLLDRLVERNLLILEARRLGYAPTDAEAEETIKKDPFFQEGGVFNQAKYLALKNANPAMFQNALAQARDNLAAKRLNDKLEKDHLPPEGPLRARLARELSHASVRYLALHGRDFAGTYPEPRESEVRAYYAAHAADYRRGESATLSLIVVNQGVDDSLSHVPGGLVKWEQSLRHRADSLLAAIKSGASMETASIPYGGLRGKVNVSPGHFPFFWRGTSAQDEMVFRSGAGAMLPELVASNPGWLLVRVDQATPAHTASLGEAAKEIRAKLREQRRNNYETEQLTAIYRARADSLRGPAYKVRYAVLDTSSLDPGEPTAQDLDRFYRGHLADYSSFDAASGTIRSEPLDQVRDEVRMRWRGQHRSELSRTIAERIQDAWSAGKRDPALERQLAYVREVGPVPLGIPVDTGAVGAVVGDSLTQRNGARGVGTARVPQGAVVFDVTDVVPNYLPTLEQVRPRLDAWRAAQQMRTDEAAARKLFDANPGSFAQGNTIYYTSIAVDPPDPLQMDMTHEQVERYRNAHLDKYSAPELMRASHILIIPNDATPAADRVAHARADSLLQAIRGGADFARLARRFSQDEATADQGGDLGQFGRGAMLPEFERVAFSLRPGDVSDVVKSSAGYHIIKCNEYLPRVVHPLTEMYQNVSYDLAIEMADSAATRRADSLLHAVRTPARALAAAEKLGLFVGNYTRGVDETTGSADERAFFAALARLKPGQLYPAVHAERGHAFSIAWLDSIAGPRPPTWEVARARAIDRYRRGAAERAIVAKQAELDSMLASGWTLDSLGTLFGGLEGISELRAGGALPGLGRGPLDSLVFGDPKAPATLKTGVTSGWVSFTGGVARLQVVAREAANSEQLAARVESEQRAAMSHTMTQYFDGLRKRYPVQILDARLRDVRVPTLSEAPAP